MKLEINKMQIKNVKVYGLYPSIIKSGYPHLTGEPGDLYGEFTDAPPTEKAVERAFKLAGSANGSGHDCALKGIIVQADIQYPEYFSPQLQRYHWIDIVSSQSKMHKITSRELAQDDFTENVTIDNIERINSFIKAYNSPELKSEQNHWFNMIISNLPSGYLKWMGISTNYLQLKTIYSQRRHHKLKDDWGYFCDWIETLPMSELITGKK